MQLQNIIGATLRQLETLLLHVTDEQYAQQLAVLSDNSIGQHIRHIVEMFECLEKGFERGYVCYEDRERSRDLESVRELAIVRINALLTAPARPDKPIVLAGYYDEQGKDRIEIESNYYRERLYNLEHAIHHMALIKIGVNAMQAAALPAGFGVAPATIRYQNSCAQ